MLERGKVGVIHFAMRDSSGKVLESSHTGGPMVYLHGYGNLVPGLERALEGQTIGAHVEVALSPEDAFGVSTGPGPQRVHRRDLPKGVALEVGRPFRAEGSGGEAVTLWVHAVAGAWVTVDVNHPLAGKDVSFLVDVMFVRDATEEEIAHRHAHGFSGEADH